VAEVAEVVEDPVVVDDGWAAELLNVEPADPISATTRSTATHSAVAETDVGDWRTVRKARSVYGKAATKPSFLEAHPADQSVAVLDAMKQRLALLQRALRHSDGTSTSSSFY
jgi:hypothetical protein